MTMPASRRRQRSAALAFLASTLLIIFATCTGYTSLTVFGLVCFTLSTAMLTVEWLRAEAVAWSDLTQFPYHVYGDSDVEGEDPELVNAFTTLRRAQRFIRLHPEYRNLHIYRIAAPGDLDEPGDES